MPKYAAGDNMDRVVPWEIQSKRKLKYVYKEKRPPNKVVARIIGFIILNLVILAANYYLLNL